MLEVQPLGFFLVDGTSGTQMGLSENSVPLNPMVFLIIIPTKWLFHREYTLFSDKPKSVSAPGSWISTSFVVGQEPLLDGGEFRCWFRGEWLQ